MFSNKLVRLIKCNSIYVSKLNYSKVGVIGAPFEKGQKKAGTALGPSSLRESSLISHLENIGCDVKDYGDVQYKLAESEEKIVAGNFRNIESVIGFNKQLSDHVSEIIKDGRLCLTLGGDHSVGLGTVHGHLKTQAETSILWVDAHADIHTPGTSVSGNAHGMPLSFNIKELTEYQVDLPGFEWHTPMLSAKHIAFVGLRDVDPMERLIIEKLGICALSMEEVHEMGMKEAVRYALSKIDPENKRHLHVSFDIDALDPSEAPSTGTPVRGGLTLREGMDLLRSLSRTGRLSAVDLVEVNPLIGSDSDKLLTLDAARHLAAAAAGYYAGGWSPKGVSEIPRLR